MSSCRLHLPHASHFFGRNMDICVDSSSSTKLSTKLCFGYRDRIKALASQNQTKRSRKRGKPTKRETNIPPSEQLVGEYDGVDGPSLGVDGVGDGSKISSSDNLEVQNQNTVVVPSRSAVLQACTVTCGLIGSLGVLLREASHIASRDGWPIVDSTASITFSTQLWHLELIAGSVIIVSSCRFLLLRTWPDFAESSEAANQQVLTSLEPLDYLVVAFLPGISEELLFRVITSCIYVIFAAGFQGTKSVTKEVLDWLTSQPAVLVAAAKLGRYFDDLGTHEHEEKGGEMLTAVDCYMKQHRLSKEETLRKFIEQAEDGWKDVNTELLKLSTSTVPKDIAMLFLNYVRVAEVTYKNWKDGYTHPEEFVAPQIVALFVDPIVI